MNCRKARVLHSEAAERRLDERRQAAYEEHLRACPRCRQEAAQVLKAVALLRATAREQAPSGMAARVAARLSAERPRPTRVPAYAWASAGVVLAAVLLGYLLVITPRSVRLYERSQAPLPEERKSAPSAQRAASAVGPLEAEGATSEREPVPGAGSDIEKRQARRTAPSIVPKESEHLHLERAQGEAYPPPYGGSVAESLTAPAPAAQPSPATPSSGPAGPGAPPSGVRALGYAEGTVEKTAVGRPSRDALTAEERPPGTAAYRAAPGPGAGRTEALAAKEEADAERERIDLVARDEPIAVVLNEISTRTGTEIVLRARTEKRVSVSLQGATAEEAVKAVSEAAGLRYRRTDGVLIVEGEPAP